MERWDFALLGIVVLACVVAIDCAPSPEALLPTVSSIIAASMPMLRYAMLCAVVLLIVSVVNRMRDRIS
ncbi:MAG: hypothetical protein A2854_01860 [Parcubacteria group bacterium RIFCSPHIGHO2_01_FULL_56_18]|nr:MAG: hypothetical protein A2854_01860 [Parcubacteria group bacterium RIFCSPHIGHO2_01_FULL_56_18]